MAFPYAGATSNLRARQEAQKILQGFGCERIGFMDDFENHEVLLVFSHRGREVQFKASGAGWANGYLKANPWNSNRVGTREKYEQKFLKQGMIAVNSVLRDWVKGQITALETGVLSFEHVFMPFMVLESGKTMFEMVNSKNLLPAPKEVS